jgi:energy-coupling factor transporter ATP-binding protein EcfA2
LFAFRVRLASALRAGHAADVSFRLTISSGPAPTLRLLPMNAGSARWAARVFTSAYERHQWRWTRQSLSGCSSVDVWSGRRSRRWPEPFRLATDLVPLLDAVVLSFGTLPPGAHCDWSIRPIPPIHRSWWETENPAPEPPSRPAGPNSVRTLDRLPTPQKIPERPLLWEVRTQIRCDPALGKRAARALESATRSVGGNGVRFRRQRWSAGTERSGFPISENELILSLPTPGCPAADEPEFRTPGRYDVLPLGRTVAGRVVGPPLESGQGRHLAVLGETGMGKSSLLVALSRTVVERSGLILFDPLGETARAVRIELPPSAAERLTWIAPDTLGGLNALEGIGSGSAPDGAQRERLLNDLVHALRRVRSGRYADSSFWGPRLEEMVTRAIRAASGLPGGTLVEAHGLLASRGRGFRTLPPEDGDALRELGDRIRSRPEDADGARRLLYEVTRSPILVRMLCATRPTLRPSDLVAPGRIVLIAGDAAEVGESTARYLLSVYLALVWSQLLARPDATKTFVILDEAQWFVHESLAEMLRLGRRRNVHVVLATQAIASLPEVVSEAVWTNVADFVAFRGSPDEAREFSRAARGILPESILSLPRGEAAVLLGKGNAVHWLRTVRIPGTQLPRTKQPDLPAEFDAAEPAEPEAPPTTGPDNSPDEPTDAGVGVEEVLRAIARHVHEDAGDSPVRISLADLRREVDPSGRAVRAAGAALGRSGALVRTGRDSVGPCWWIDRHRI